jgi:hypothetical protein
VKIEEAVGQLKRVDPNGQLVRTAEDMSVEFGRPDNDKTETKGSHGANRKVNHN